MNYTKKDYLDYVDTKSPRSNIVKNCIWAFVVGGLICVLGEALSDFYKGVCGLDKDSAKTSVSITLIFLSALFTGLNLYHKLAKHAGAGTLVPITGFANAIVAPAVEFKREGFVLGVAAKMFTIAGPVLAYGIGSSVAVGFIYWIMTLFK